MPVSRSGTATLTENLQSTEGLMRAYFVVLWTLRRTSALTPEELYGFSASDVSEIHRYKAGTGPGVWYRLKDGRVFDSLGRPSRRDRVSYSMRIPNVVKTVISLFPPLAKVAKREKSARTTLKQRR